MKTQINKNNILVVGDLMIDHYLLGNSERISPEAPVQIVNIIQQNTVLGGAGNVISNLKSFGANVSVLSVIGDCRISLELKELLRSIDVSTSNLISEKDRVSSKKTRVISAHQQVLRFDFETSKPINNNSENKLLSKFGQIFKEFDVIILSDYGKGVITEEVSQFIINKANEFDIKVLVDPKGQNFNKYKNAYLITPNKKEASIATSNEIKDQASLESTLKKLKKSLNLSVSLITLSEEGIAVFDNKLMIYPTKAKEVFDVTGAGDTVIASLALMLAKNQTIENAVKFANIAAGIVVSKIGSATTTIREVEEFSMERRVIFNNSKDLLNALDRVNKKIVFTNGCFDIVHSGHTKYLETAKQFGDILIVGINTDQSVKKLKGNSRPVNNQIERAEIISSLKSVDYVVFFDDDTPYKLIKSLRPDVLVKGGDYEINEIVGKDIVKDVRIVKYIDNRSTSNLIRKIKNLNEY